MEQKNNKIQKSSATILPSQWEIIKSLPKNQQLPVITALIEYELYGIEPKLGNLKENSVLSVFWQMSKPLIEKRVRRAENGRTGGFAKAENSKRVANSSKRVANSGKKKQTLADKDKEKDKDMDKEYPYPTDTLLNGASLDKGDNKKEDEFDIAEWSVPDDFFDDVKD